MRLWLALARFAVAFAVLPTTGPRLLAETDRAVPASTPDASNAAAIPDDSDRAAAPEKNAASATLVSGQQPVAAAAATADGDAKADQAAKLLPTAAERIAKLETAIEADNQRLATLRASLEAPDSEYAKAEAGFRELDARRTLVKQQVDDLAKADKHDELAQTQAKAAELEKKWTLAKERFDLAIGERKAMQESVATLERKLESDRSSLAKLKDAGKPQPLQTSPAAPPQLPPASPQATPAPAATSPQTAPLDAAAAAPSASIPPPTANALDGPPSDPQPAPRRRRRPRAKRRPCSRNKWPRSWPRPAR